MRKHLATRVSDTIPSFCIHFDNFERSCMAATGNVHLHHIMLQVADVRGYVHIIYTEPNGGPDGDAISSGNTSSSSSSVQQHCGDCSTSTLKGKMSEALSASITEYIGKSHLGSLVLQTLLPCFGSFGACFKRHKLATLLPQSQKLGRVFFVGRPPPPVVRPRRAVRRGLLQTEAKSRLQGYRDIFRTEKYLYMSTRLYVARAQFVSRNCKAISPCIAKALHGRVRICSSLAMTVDTRLVAT